MKKLTCLCALLFCGCNTIHVSNTDGTKTTDTRIQLPAWPWQNSTTIVDKFNLSSRTNTFTLSLKSSQTETGDTNFWSGLNGVVGSAVGAAVKAAKP
jgi:hypothetical protein